MVLASGIYTADGPDADLLECPPWNTLPRDGWRRVLDLRTGLLAQERDGARAVLFSSLARPGTTAVRTEGLELEAAAPQVARAVAGGVASASRVTGGDRLTAYVVDPERVPAAEEAAAALEGVELDRCSPSTAPRGQRAGPPPTCASRATRSSSGRRGSRSSSSWRRRRPRRGGRRRPRAHRARLSGPCLLGRGHLRAPVPRRDAPGRRRARCWSTGSGGSTPRRANARKGGRAGARFPWESARDRRGRHAALRGSCANGERAPSSRASSRSTSSPTSPGRPPTTSSGPATRAFADGPGRELLVETARYWASRIGRDPDGSAHIGRVIGPDEYHEPVDDNAFTNVMARWNLRRARRRAGRRRGRGRGAIGCELADALVDGYDAATGLYEQFAGFFELEPLIDRRDRAAPADRRRPAARRASGCTAPRSSSRPTC